jgi:outer membrane biosynthesis protein TonB
MASIPAQEEFLAVTRKSQEAMIAAIKTWFETVRTATPKLTSVYAPLTDRLPRLPSVNLPFADKLPTPEEAVDNAYHVAEELLAGQRKFAEDLLKAMAPLMPGRGTAALKGNGPSEPEVSGQRVWHEAVAVSEPKPVAVREPRPVAVSEPKPVAVSEPKPVAVSEPQTVAAAEAEPKAPAHPAAKSTPARPAPKGTATPAKSTAAKSTAAKSGAARSTTGTSTPKRSAGRTPKGTDAS